MSQILHNYIYSHLSFLYAIITYLTRLSLYISQYSDISEKERKEKGKKNNYIGYCDVKCELKT